MVSFDSLPTPSMPPRQVRVALVAASVIGVIFNIVIAIIGRTHTEGALGIVFLTLSGLLSIFQLASPKSKPTLNMVLDLFFAVSLLLLYIIVLALSYALRVNIFGVYANLACLVSSCLHGYAFFVRLSYCLASRFFSGAASCPHCSARPADYKTVPSMGMGQESQGDPEHGTHQLDNDDDDDERTPLYRDSEEGAVV